MSMGDPPPAYNRVPLAHTLAVTKAYVDDLHTDSVLNSMMYPKITNMASLVTVFDAENDPVGTVTPAELVKYIRERELIEENQTVRTLWERYQVAVRLVGSEDNGQAD
jgi:hypothetical protein